MNRRITSVADALELYTPPFAGVDDRWAEIARHAVPAPAPRRSWRRPLLAAAAVVVATTLIATPAFGIRGLIADLIGRIDVTFSSQQAAPVEVKRDFYDLGLGAPGAFAPQAIASEARQVTTFSVHGTRHALWVAPTRSGGYCWQIGGGVGGCREGKQRTTVPLSVTYTNAQHGAMQAVALIAGDITAPTAHALTIDYADGTHTDVPFYYVSKPIDAGFFFAAIPAGHDTEATRPRDVVLRDAAGHSLGRTTFHYQTAAQVAAHRARIEHDLKRLRSQKRPTLNYPSPNLPAPTAPVQTGGAGGVTVTAGHNGVVVFDTTDVSPAVRKLIDHNANGYGCFKRLPYHSAPVTVTSSRTFAKRVAIQLDGVMSPPYMGCVIEGTYGHRWPDRNGNHSAVEIALVPAAKTFFTDRAAARDLALFVRSRTMHAVRKLTGAALSDALRRDYGDQIVAGASPPVGRIGYTTVGATTTFVERSPTGRRFFISFVNGRLHDQNLKPYAYPF